MLDKKIHHEGKGHEIRVVLIGQEVPEASIAIARSKMKDYKLDNTKLIVLQGMNNEAVDISSIRAMVMEDFYKNSEQLSGGTETEDCHTGAEFGKIQNLR